MTRQQAIDLETEAHAMFDAAEAVKTLHDDGGVSAGALDWALNKLIEEIAAFRSAYKQALYSKEMDTAPVRIEPPQVFRKRPKNPGRSQAARKGWEKRRRTLAARGRNPVVAEGDTSNVIPLR